MVDRLARHPESQRRRCFGIPLIGCECSAPVRVSCWQETGYPKPGEKFGPLTGAPVLEKLMGCAPIEDIDRCEHVARRFIIAEKEELFNSKDNAILTCQRATGIKKLVTIKGIKHHGIYYEKRKQAQQLALESFDEHLKRQTP